MILFFIIGFIFLILGILSFIMKKKINNDDVDYDFSPFLRFINSYVLSFIVGITFIILGLIILVIEKFKILN